MPICQKHAEIRELQRTAEFDRDTDEMAWTTRHRCLLTCCLPLGDNSPMADRDAIEQEYQRQLEAIKNSGPEFAFDRDGRPGAIAAVREALPLIERELFDAIIEDFECELAAHREVLFRMTAG